MDKALLINKCKIAVRHEKNLLTWDKMKSENFIETLQQQKDKEIG